MLGAHQIRGRIPGESAIFKAYTVRRGLIIFKYRSTDGDLILYTVTEQDGGTVRVYVPVLDVPNILQLHAVVDRYGFLPESSSPVNGSRVFWLDKAVVRQVLEAALQECEDRGENSDMAARRKPLLQQMLDEGWDLFARILPDGSLVLRALAVCGFVVYLNDRLMRFHCFKSRRISIDVLQPC